MAKLTNWLLNKLSNYLLNEIFPPRSYLCDFERICYEVRPADVLLIEGRNRASKIIQKITLSHWSHAALYIGRIHDVEDPLLREQLSQHYNGPAYDQLLIESLPGLGTVISPITKYKVDHIRICRPAGLSYKDAQKIIAQAIDHIGREYNLRQFLDLGRFLLASHFIPWSWKSTLFSQPNPSQVIQDICSTMIADAFGSVQFPILPLVQKGSKNEYALIARNTKLYTPTDFDYSPYFNIIKYPIFPIADAPPYKHLPWQEGLVYSDRIGISEINPKPNSK